MGPAWEGARPAVSDDAERIAELCLLGRTELRGQRGGDLFTRRESPSSQTPAEVIRRLGSQDRAVWVGTFEGHVVGYGLSRVESIQGGQLHGVVEELYVQPEARSVGVGRAIMEGLVGWLAGKGCAGVDAGALPGNRALKSFLESSGFKARLIVLHRSLGS